MLRIFSVRSRPVVHRTSARCGRGGFPRRLILLGNLNGIELAKYKLKRAQRRVRIRTKAFGRSERTQGPTPFYLPGENVDEPGPKGFSEEGRRRRIGKHGS